MHGVKFGFSMSKHLLRSILPNHRQPLLVALCVSGLAELLGCSDDQEHASTTPDAAAQADAPDSADSAKTTGIHTFAITHDDLLNKQPDAVYHAVDGEFAIVYASSPLGDNKEEVSYQIISQRISSSGAVLGEPFVLRDESFKQTMPRMAYNPVDNHLLLAHIGFKEPMPTSDVYITLFDSNGVVLQGPQATTQGPGMFLHPSVAYNTKRNEYLVVYNDMRKDIGDIYGILVDAAGTVVKSEFLINGEQGGQVHPVPCYNPDEDNYLISWEDYRHISDPFNDPSDLMGALVSAEGVVERNDLALIDDHDSPQGGDQRFNDIVYNPDEKQYLVLWTDQGPAYDNVAIAGRFVLPDGTMSGAPFAIADGPGVQAISSAIYLPGIRQYLVLWNNNEEALGDADKRWFSEVDMSQIDLSIFGALIGKSGRRVSDLVPIFQGKGNHLYVDVAYDPVDDVVLATWQQESGSPEAKPSGHSISVGGTLWGAVFQPRYLIDVSMKPGELR